MSVQLRATTQPAWSNVGGSGRVGETVQDQRALPELANIGQQLFVVPALVIYHNDFLEIPRVESSTAFYIE
jgi:hypothetical protein